MNAGGEDFQRLLATVLSSVSEGVVVADAAGNLVDWNDAALAMHGFDDLAQVRKHLATFPETFELRTPEGEVLLLERWPMSRALGGETFSRLELWVRRLDTGLEMRVAYSGTPVRHADGSVAMAVLIIHDLTERRRSEELLLHNRRQMEVVVQGANVGVWYCPLPFDRLLWDAKVKEHFHLPPEADVTIETFYERLHPDDRDRTRAAIGQSIERKSPYDIEYRTVSPDGARTHWIRATGRGFYDAAGDPVRFDGITIDVTAQKRAEAALRDSERRFREMADTAPAMLWITEADGHCSFLSRGWCEFTGQTLKEGLGYGWANAAHPDDRALAAGAFRDATERRAGYEVDFRLRRADGQYRWVIDAGRPRFGADGQFLGFIGSVIDVHDRKAAEAERERLLDAERAARLQAEHAGRLKDDFLATLSHELRTPLNAILGWSQLLARGSARDDAQALAEGLSAIARNARAQTQLIDDLLDMSRITAGKLRLAVQPVSPAEVVEAAIESVRPAAAAKDLKIEKVLDPFAGPVAGDPHRLQQAVWNLLTNAVKFTPRGGRIQVLLERVNSHIEITVSDTGQGIKPEFLPHMFERFRQADASTTRRHGGLGIGLALVKEIVALHGGEVRAKSPGEGRGATFVISMPLSLARSEERQGGHGAARGAGGAADANDDGQRLAAATDGIDLGGLKALVVDDDADSAVVFRRILGERGATVFIADSAEAGLASLKRDRPDVLVSDIGMPLHDGYELIRRVRALRPDEGGRTPAVALTAFARSEDRRRALLAGFQSHVCKPVEPPELVTVVASLAGRTGA